MDFLIKWIVSEINVKTFWNRVGHWEHQLVVQTNFLNYKYNKIHRQQKQKKIKVLPHFLHVFEHLEPCLNFVYLPFHHNPHIYYFWKNWWYNYNIDNIKVLTGGCLSQSRVIKNYFCSIFFLEMLYINVKMNSALYYVEYAKTSHFVNKHTNTYNLIISLVSATVSVSLLVTKWQHNTFVPPTKVLFMLQLKPCFVSFSTHITKLRLEAYMYCATIFELIKIQIWSAKWSVIIKFWVFVCFIMKCDVLACLEMHAMCVFFHWRLCCVSNPAYFTFHVFHISPIIRLRSGIYQLKAR